MSRVSGGEPRTPHSLSLAIDDIHNYANGISQAFDAANELIASNSPVDEGFASDGSASTYADLDRTMQDLDLAFGVLRGYVTDLGLLKFYGLETISDRLARKPHVSRVSEWLLKSLLGLVASELKQIVTQICQIGVDLREFFSKDRQDPYYDVDHTVRQSVKLIERERDDLCADLAKVANRLPPPLPPVRTGLRLCPSARRLVDGQDDGYINYIDRSYLTNEQKELLSQSGGTFQYWKCSDCRLEIKFYVRQSQYSTLLTTRETRKCGRLTIREALLAKSHLDQRHKSTSHPRYACLICVANGADLQRDRTAFEYARDLARHLNEKHNKRSLPDLIMRELRFVGQATREDNVLYDLKFA